MEHSILMESGKNFVLCENCKDITVFEFLRCHRCKKSIDKKSYKQHTSIDKYFILLRSLMSFEIDVLEDCHSMISISRVGDKSFAPELQQIWKENNIYTYIHFEKDTHNILEKRVMDDLSFIPPLKYNEMYKVELIYGPHGIFIHQ